MSNPALPTSVEASLLRISQLQAESMKQINDRFALIDKQFALDNERISKIEARAALIEKAIEALDARLNLAMFT